jgi:hypothetical protein
MIDAATQARAQAAFEDDEVLEGILHRANQAYVRAQAQPHGQMASVRDNLEAYVVRETLAWLLQQV